MKALTIRQPWASLVALGVKHIETRTRPAPKAMIGQHFAVHAGCAQPPFGLQLGPWTIVDTPGRWVASDCDRHLVHDMPLGAIVATARLVDSVPIVDALTRDGRLVALRGQHSMMLAGPLPTAMVGGADPNAGHTALRNITDQLPYGDYRPGRWAWLLDDVKPTTARCPKCWGAGGGRYFPQDDSWCRQCDAAGTCPPIPAKGRLGFWTWQP